MTHFLVPVSGCNIEQFKEAIAYWFHCVFRLKLDRRNCQHSQHIRKNESVTINYNIRIIRSQRNQFFFQSNKKFNTNTFPFRLPMYIYIINRTTHKWEWKTKPNGKNDEKIHMVEMTETRVSFHICFSQFSWIPYDAMRFENSLGAFVNTHIWPMEIYVFFSCAFC